LALEATGIVATAGQVIAHRCHRGLLDPGLVLHLVGSTGLEFCTNFFTTPSKIDSKFIADSSSTALIMAGDKREPEEELRLKAEVQK
jgi:hypothetical protein